MKPLNKEKKSKVVSITIFIGCLIGLFVIILSVAHCAALFTRAGYHGTLSYIGVAAFELTFLLGTGILIYSKWKGEKVGRASRFVLIIGVLINLYSNVTSGIAIDGQPLVFWVINGMEINEAVLIGALIPLLIVMAEMVVSDAISKTRAMFNQPSKNLTNESYKSTSGSTTSTTSTNEIDQNNGINHLVDESTNEIIQEKEIVHEVIQPVDEPSNHNVNQPVVQPTISTNSTTSTKSSKSSNHSVNHTINHPTSHPTTHSTTRPVKDNQPMKEKSTNQKWLKADQPPSKPTIQSIQSTNRSSNQSSKKSTSSSNSSTSSKLSTSSTNQPDDSTNGSTTNSTKLVDLSSNSSNNSTTSTTSTNQPKTPIEWALQYLDEHGELPSRRKLAELAGCTQHKAGNALKKLREEGKG